MSKHMAKYMSKRMPKNTGGDPSKKLHVPPSWWSCSLAGGSRNYSPRNQFKSFPYKKCSGKGAEAPGTWRKFMTWLCALLHLGGDRCTSVPKLGAHLQ